jgi:hypothetical protein
MEKYVIYTFKNKKIRIMKKIFLIASTCLLINTIAQAQWAGEPRKKGDYKNTEQEGTKSTEFEVVGFARDKDEREIRAKKATDAELNGFDNKAEEKAARKAAKMNRADKKTFGQRKARADRYRDVEVLMLDLNLAKIQKPVFRGIMTEHLRDVNAILANAELINAEKNIQLKQVYALRTKRLRETLTDEQYRKWLKIRDEDEFLLVEKPEDY